MPSLWMIAGHAGHALAAALLASLAILTSRRFGRLHEGRLLVVALAVTALWSLRHALAGVLRVDLIADGVAETVRNGAWLAVLAYYLRRRPDGAGAHRGRQLVLVALAFLLSMQLCLDLVIGEGASVSAALLPVFEASWLLRDVFALGALVMLHGLSVRREETAGARREIWVGGAMALMWAYDFNHYILAWLLGGPVEAVAPMRGFVMALATVLLVVGLRTDGTRRIALSRTVMMRLVSLGIIALYVLVVVMAAMFSGEIAAPLGRLTQSAMLFALAVSVLALMPSASLRSWLRVAISKHLFAHRYDYRALWLRFAANVADNAEETVPLDERITRAIAEAVDAPAAALYLADAEGRLACARQWRWLERSTPPEQLAPELADEMARRGWIVDVAADWPRYGAMLPDWMRRSADAWAIAPLIHHEQLVGAILLAQPPGGRRLDWEDLDVLRVVCNEAATRISEARSRAALAEAQRFDEFNRRFAFILHDLKNLVSHMTLLASNAQRHADNPAFREDMVLTLRETASRMTELLQRLGRPGAPPRETASMVLGPLVRTLAPNWAAGLGLVEVTGDAMRPVRGDADSLSRAMAHLVRNAIEASPAGRIVQIMLSEEEEAACLRVVDRGEGMAPAFIRDELFRPFSSTKADGFGLGAHEARLLISAMGGSLDVESRPGEGTCFTIRLPFAAKQAADTPTTGSVPARKTG
ncbi:two-component system sensor histidine kinase [Sphingobium sp. SYK-6]|uniref:XrtA/PEP-CTERM system histidine kinase PrsK n=1 Tax=Sphingobium sp. (strain NBRC 103272 / SYK-6) TaxID=627192 RepID=UPI00022771CE|nr:XrtA/PEP-CTERM system histidine kinase PrsK [Sphingobium sp. SYK-6]BAK66945.1 two-component system sensor histidine kinase [Sphingobium sp. SYK-6]